VVPSRSQGGAHATPRNMSHLAEVQAFLQQECFHTLYIDGAFVGASGGTFDTIAPATEQVIAQCPKGSAADMEAAVAAARAAFDRTDWGWMPASNRASLLRQLAAKLEQNQDIIAKIESLDMGKHYDDAVGDVGMCVAILSENADLCEELERENNKPVAGNELNTGYQRWEPFGVCGAITPWNYPIACVVTKLAPALAVGNTLVIKPSEYTPLSSMLLAKLCDEVGFPAGVVNFVTGLGAEAGATLANSPDIDMISFTGSIPTGSTIMAAAAKSLTKPLLELGGKSAAVVFDDVDVDEVVPWLMQVRPTSICSLATHSRIQI
jgi:betaine-aldehyde dehydrogenase